MDRVIFVPDLIEYAFVRVRLHGMQGRGGLARRTAALVVSRRQLTGFGWETTTIPPNSGVLRAQVHRNCTLHLGNVNVPPNPLGRGRQAASSWKGAIHDFIRSSCTSGRKGTKAAHAEEPIGIDKQRIGNDCNQEDMDGMASLKRREPSVIRNCSFRWSTKGNRWINSDTADCALMPPRTASSSSSRENRALHFSPCPMGPNFFFFYIIVQMGAGPWACFRLLLIFIF